jgi:hypothetical protein
MVTQHHFHMLAAEPDAEDTDTESRVKNLAENVKK